MPDHSQKPIAEDRSAPVPAPASEPPMYTKPRLRRYDQIEQVKPYGPSERKAG